MCEDCKTIILVKLKQLRFICNGWVGQDLCMPNVCPPFEVDKDQVPYTLFQGLTFTNLCTTLKELSASMGVFSHKYILKVIFVQIP